MCYSLFVWKYCKLSRIKVLIKFTPFWCVYIVCILLYLQPANVKYLQCTCRLFDSIKGKEMLDKITSPNWNSVSELLLSTGQLFCLVSYWVTSMSHVNILSGLICPHCTWQSISGFHEYYAALSRWSRYTEKDWD